MAIYTPGPVVGAISGNLGGVSFVNGKGSKVIRHARRAGRQANAQTALASSLTARFARAWSGLTDLHRASWNTYAANRTHSNRLGVDRPLSGYQEWMKRGLQVTRNAPFLDPNPPADITSPGLFDWILSAGVVDGVLLDFTNPTGPGFVRAHFYGRPLFRSTIPAFNNSWRFFGFNTTVTEQYDLTALWTSTFGDLREDQVIAVRVLNISITDPTALNSIDLFAKTTP